MSVLYVANFIPIYPFLMFLCILMDFETLFETLSYVNNNFRTNKIINLKIK